MKSKKRALGLKLSRNVDLYMQDKSFIWIYTFVKVSSEFALRWFYAETLKLMTSVKRFVVRVVIRFNTNFKTNIEKVSSESVVVVFYIDCKNVL